MVAKITVSNSFKGVVEYIMDKAKNAEIVASDGIRTFSVSSIIDSFEMQSQIRPNIKRPAYHISLNFAPEDTAKLTPELIDAVMRDYLKMMGLDNTQFIAVRHYDKAHQHIHLCINRIDYDGKLISTKNDRIRNHKICRELTERYGLHISRSYNMNYDRLRDKELCRILIRDALRQSLPHTTNWQSLIAILRKQGIETEFKYKGSTDQIEGVKFTIHDKSFSGSKISREFSYSKINALFSQKEEQQRDEDISFIRLQANETKQDSKNIINNIGDFLFNSNNERMGGGTNNELPKRKKR